jgi:hypothetical protein
LPYSVVIGQCEVCRRVFQFNPKRAPAVFFERNGKGEPDPHWAVLCKPCTLRLKQWFKKQADPQLQAQSRYRIDRRAYEAEEV